MYAPEVKCDMISLTTITQIAMQRVDFLATGTQEVTRRDLPSQSMQLKGGKYPRRP